MTLRKSMSAMLALAALAGVGTIAHRAYASTKTACTITQIQYDNGRIALWCANDAAIYYAFQSHPYCGTQSLDTMKQWLGMLQARLLSAKPVDFDYNAPAGSCIDRNIYSLRVY
jgi:hypothetical protein